MLDEVENGTFAPFELFAYGNQQKNFAGKEWNVAINLILSRSLYFFRYTMKILNVKQSVDIPEGVEASVKSRIVTIKGARGTLKRNFRHLAVDIFMSTPTSITVR